MGGMMGGGGKGGGGGGGGGGNTLADAFFAEQALGQNEQAVHNRYQQLGIGKPHTGTAAGAAATGQSLTYGGPSTMEQMDIGTIPTRTGGAMGMADALMGQLFNPQREAGFGPGGPLEQLAQQQQQQEQAGFGAATGGFGRSSAFG
ncbi:MAG TPA: hypothetical protein VKP67_23355 [Xanthobacteraceae bacterium]|nr:hypothetical protein [Xanthobacteraceae bacterium]